MTTDYKATICLPETDFAMKAGLPAKEPGIVAAWQKDDLYGQLRQASKGREKFILHDGPPYANGHLHIGHALNKILKDVINRSQQMLGKDANYVPGWDCHGLPIEWKIEEQYRAKGLDKDEVPINEFRQECREFADHWVGVQREEFKRLGVIGDWEDPYLTMSFQAEAQIARELMKFSASGQLYRGSKPVMWSVVEKTALAEAEIEYKDNYESDTIWAKFPVIEGPDGLADASVVIWTTTPWTIPGNRAICYSPKIKYGLYEVTAADDGNWAAAGDKLVLADALAADVMKAARVEGFERRSDIDVSKITTCAHPFRGQGYDFDVPMLAGDHVTDEAGTGFVHTAPGHGAEDFEAWTSAEKMIDARGIGTAIPFTVDADGFFTDEAPGLTGKRVITGDGDKGDANQAVIDMLVAAGRLIARGRLKHSYPHSWRSKKPVIFRNTPQWFISMGDTKGKDGLREIALQAIADTRFVPPAGQRRLHGMIEQRPDWVISRQRAWGVPITVFVNRESGEILQDETVNKRIADAFEAEGADAWFADDAAARFLANDYTPDDWEKVDDILDVWFDSGSTHAFCLEQRDDLAWPASLYLEGSDQHRGWFHSSLLESCGTRGRAPYDAVLTHGFVMAEDGQKMSKSLGNVVAPQSVVDQFGADILRLWVVGSDYSEDLRIGPEIIKHQVDHYRRLRNTLRYILGNLAGFSDAERMDARDMPELDRWVQHRLADLDVTIRQAIEDYDFHTIYRRLHDFCAVDLSAFYFDIRKDALYCDPLDSVRRRAARQVLKHLFDCLTAWLAPILCFTAEEAWAAGGGDGSVHLRVFPDIPADWRDEALAEKWRGLREIRRVVTGAIELERAEKRIRASLQARPVLYLDGGRTTALDETAWAEIAITSEFAFGEGAAPDDAFRMSEIEGVAVVIDSAGGEKCERCWMVLDDVGSVAAHPSICARCADAVERNEAMAVA